MQFDYSFQILDRHLSCYLPHPGRTLRSQWRSHLLSSDRQTEFTGTFPFFPRGSPVIGPNIYIIFSFFRKRYFRRGIIDGYTREAGVRNLERTITSVLRKCARKIASGEVESVAVTAAMLEELLGPRIVKPDFLNRTNAVGIANGLAWTSIGGETLPIEVQVMDNGTGKITVTGSLGDVMKESATIAHEWVMAHHKELGIDPEMFEKNDINIHVPEGAIPKDGPSAGITMVTSIVSTYTGRKVRERIAMTGETTLRGRVMPVGGIKEKILAAKRAGIKELILSEDNRKDISEIKAEYIDGLTFHYVRTNEDVLRLALEEKK